MTDTESKLLDMIKKFINHKNGKKTLQEEIKELIDHNKDDEKQPIIRLLSFIIEKDKIIDDDSLFGFKEIIIQKFIEILTKEKCNAMSLIQIFYKAENESLKKIIVFSMLLAKKVDYSVLDIFFMILNNKLFSFIQNWLKGIGINNFNNNKDLINRIYCKTEDDMLNAFNAVDDFKDLDIKSLLINDNEKLNNISEINEINKSERKKSENIGDDKREINPIFNEEINNNKIKKEERNKRIFGLISENMTVRDNQKLKENDTINLNYNQINVKNERIINEIMFDKYKIENTNYLYLFSPISLIINEYKKEFDKSDFEIFNKDNHYIELFGKYLIEIIDKLNMYIKNGNEQNFIEENKIKFGSYKNHFYLCCKMNEKFKDEHYKNIDIYKNIRIDNKESKESKKTKIIKIKNKDEDNKEILKKNDINMKIVSTFTNERYSKDNYKYKLAYNLENEIREYLLTDKNEELQNLLFFFNLKVPKKTETTIEFESVTLFSSSFDNNLYGFREIDVCCKNNEKIKLPEEIFQNNFSFKYNKSCSSYEKNKNNDIDVSLENNEIIFCEIKNSFPNITSGSQKHSKIKINNDENYENNYSITLIDQLENLLKKAKLFYLFFDTKRKKNTRMHILYIYDEVNINGDDIDDNIFKSIKNCSYSLNLPAYFNNVIFQIVYFNKDESKRKKEEELIRNIRKENDEIVKQLKKENDEIKKNNEEKDVLIKKYEDLLRKNNIEY